MTKPYGPWQTLDSASVNPGKPAANTAMLWNGGWVRAGYDEPFANDCVWEYANACHNVLAVPYCGSREFSSDSVSFRIAPSAPGDKKAFAVVPVEGRIIQPGTLRVWWYAYTSSESAANTVTLEAAIVSGRDGLRLAHASTTVCATSGDWYSVDITLPPTPGSGSASGMGATGLGVLTPYLALYAMRDSGAANYVTIESVCAYQVAPDGTPAHLALDAPGSVFGQEDIPRSTAIAHKLQDEVNSIYGNRLQRSNVLSHWFTTPYDALDAAYPADDGNIGKYKLVKRAGCSTMYTYACVNEANGAGDAILKFTMTTTTEATATCSNITQASASYWVGAAFTFSTADTALEKELTLNLCGKRQISGDAANLIVHGLCVTEKPISATSISYTVPDLGARGHDSRAYGSVIRASQQSEECSVLTHLWKRAPAIALSDWRSGMPSYQNRLLCAVETPTKHDPQPPLLNSASSMIARGLVYPSVGRKRLRITLGVQRSHTAAGSAPSVSDEILMYVWMQLSTSTVLATYAWNGPTRYESYDGSFAETWLESSGNAEFEELNAVGSDAGRRFTTFETLPPFHGYRPTHRITCYTPPVTTTYTLSPSSTITAARAVQPLQVMVMAWTSDSDGDHYEYLCPVFLAVDEMPLKPEEIS